MIKSKKSMYNLLEMCTASELDKRKIKFLHKHLKYKYWAYKCLHKRYVKIYNSLMVTSLIIASGSTISGAFIPVLLTLNALPLLIQAIIKHKNFEHKITMLKFAYTSYQKLINSLVQLLDDDTIDFKEFITKLDVTDQIVIDMCIPIPSKFHGLYYKEQKKIEAIEKLDHEQD